MRLRGWLMQLGYPLESPRHSGLVTGLGYDAYVRRIVFPLESNLYGRSLSASAPPHRFLPGLKGGLYSWERVRAYPEVILVEGLFDYASLWEAGFHNVTCSLGTHLRASCATAHAPHIWPLMPIPTVVVSRRHRASRASFGKEAS